MQMFARFSSHGNCAGVFARSARSFAQSVSVIVSIRCHLLLNIFGAKPFSFIYSIDISINKSINILTVGFFASSTTVYSLTSVVVAFSEKHKKNINQNLSFSLK